MSDGQWGVFMLLLLLLGMEALRSPVVGGFLKTLVTPFKQAAA